MRRILFTLVLFLLVAAEAQASIFSQLHAIVHDQQHRPIKGATITVKASRSVFAQTAKTGEDGSVVFASIPLGEYVVSVVAAGFQSRSERLTLASGTAPVLHLMLSPGTVKQSVHASVPPSDANVDTATTTTIISREEIEHTPGADRTNSMAMITDSVPGAYMAHDMLHMRGGHQIGWQIDGVLIPNTNIATNVGTQMDPKDIETIEVQRGSYTADIGDRTYGIFNVVPRNGFEVNREGEVVLSAGNFLQTNDQINLGDHTERVAWYAGVNGNRSDYGLAPPIEKVYHDAENGAGGFGSLFYNRTPEDQFRLVGQLRNDFFQIPYDPDPNSMGNTMVFNSSGLRDVEKERDGFLLTSWLHSFNSSTVLQISPFYHYNSADYIPNPADLPVATSFDRRSQYEGGQAGITSSALRNNTLQVGGYGFAQQDVDTFGIKFNDGSSTNIPTGSTNTSASLAETYLSDSFKLRPWLTLIGGLRFSHFESAIVENIPYPRFGAALEIPKLHWVVRGFYGRFYQPPPIITLSGPLAIYAKSQNTSFVPLHGERDEEQQFGIKIPLRGWMLDIDNFRTRSNNFLDHSMIGESTVYIPITSDGALTRGWELTLVSPRMWNRAQLHLAYSNQIAESRGPVTGGLISAPMCPTAFGYCPLDHDQRNTLNLGLDVSLPGHSYASTHVEYGSGLTNGMLAPGAYLPAHTTFDLAVGKHISKRLSATANLVNVANHRVLLDNSVTIGGLHFNDPRQIYGEVRYRFKF